MENAMIRLEARYGIPRNVLFALRYRAAKDPKASIYFRLQAAWAHFRGQQLRALAHDLEVTRLISGETASVKHATSVIREGDDA
jgi:hypothetical protein